MSSKKESNIESDSDLSSDEEDDIDIHEVVRTGTLNDVKEVVSKDRPKYVCAKDKFGRIPLHYAVFFDREDVVVYLLAKKSFINAKDNKEQTPLHLAAMQGLTHMVRLLMEEEQPANIRAKDCECWTALHHAVAGKFYDTATVLVKRGADLKAEDHKFGRTPLHLAAENGFAEIAEMLIVRGSDMQALGDNSYGKTPLHLACIHGHTDTCKVLVDRGADVAALSGFLDKTPLHCAAEGGFLLCASIIADTGTWLDVTGERINGCTPLHLAVEHDHVDMVELLIDKGANKEQWGKFSVVGPPLHYACQHNKLACARKLLSMGCDLNHRDVNHQTALHVACKYENDDIMLYLLELGADFRLKGNNGKLPLDYIKVPLMRETFKIISARMDAIREEEEYLAAEKRKREEIERHREQKRREEEAAARERERIYQEERTAKFKGLLLAAADISGELAALRMVIEEYPEQDYNTTLDEARYGNALTLSASRGFAGVVRQLLDWDEIDINRRDALGNTALHYAALNQDRELVEELLLFPGIKIGLVNADGKVPVNYAKTSYMQEILRNPTLIVNKSRYQTRVRRSLEDHAAHVEARSLTVADSTGSRLVPMIPSPGKGGGPLAIETSLSPTKTEAPKSFNVGSAKMVAVAPNSSPPGKSKSGFIIEPLKSPVSLTVNSKVTDKFGVVPNSFGGCRADLFLRDKRDCEAAPTKPSEAQALSSLFAHLPSIVEAPKPKDLLTLQRSYLPTAFDLTSEYCEVKDFLWLIGYPYKPVKRGSGSNDNQDTAQTGNQEPSEMVDTSSLEELPADLPDGTQLTGQSLATSTFAEGASEYAYLDKKYHLYRLGRVMDDLQVAFTDTATAAPVEPEAPQWCPPREAVVLPALVSPKPITQTVASSFLQHSSKLPTITAKGVVQSYVSENSSAPYQLPPGTSLFDKPPPAAAEGGAETDLSVDYTHHHMPVTMTKRDFERLLRLSRLCDDFVSHLLNLYEPDYYGWPEVNAEGYFMSTSDKIDLIYDTQIITEAVVTLLRQLVTLGYAHNNEECRVRWEREQTKQRLKQKQKSKRKATYSEASAQDYNIFSVARDEEAPSADLAPDSAAASEPSWEALTNAPRYMRHVMDAVYEVSHFIHTQAEGIYELDAIRAHLWAHNGRTLIEKHAASGQKQHQTPLQKWLIDIKLLEYEKYFAAEGFKELEDFEGLSEQDCKDFFPFLKVGDCRRLVKHVYILTDGLVNGRHRVK